MLIMRAVVSLALTASLLVAPVARAALEGCPDEPDKCPKVAPTGARLYSKQTIEVGPFTVIVEVAVENGSAEAETVAAARAGDSGEVTFSFVAGPNATEGASYNVSIDLQDEVEGLAWPGATERAFEHQPQPGVARTEAFAFRVDEDAPPGRIDASFTLAVDNATHAGSVSVEVRAAASQERGAGASATPAPGAALALLAASLVALALRRARSP